MHHISKVVCVCVRVCVFRNAFVTRCAMTKVLSCLEIKENLDAES